METIQDDARPPRDILRGAYAINVHHSAEEIDVYIARGDTGGVITPGDEGEDEIRFVFQELSDSGHTGIVCLEAEGDQAEVNIMLLEPGVMSRRSVTPQECTRSRVILGPSTYRGVGAQVWVSPPQRHLRRPARQRQLEMISSHERRRVRPLVQRAFTPCSASLP